MMLNWKKTLLGQHARFIVHARVLGTYRMKDPDVKIGVVSIVTRKEAIVDVRWTGKELEVFGRGSFWPDIEKVLETRLSPRRMRDGVHCVYYGDAPNPPPLALADFESFVREMMRQPGWSVQEFEL
jgi:hypothetical protein